MFSKRKTQSPKKTKKKKQKKTKKAKQNKKRHPQPREGGDEILSKLQLSQRETERQREREIHHKIALATSSNLSQLHRILANFIESSHYSGKSMVTDLPHQVIFNLYYTNQIHHSLLY